MISKARLRAAMTAGKVAFDTEGNPVGLPELDSAGEAILIVSPVTDAMKRLSGQIVESLDRDRMWAVEAMVLDQQVIEALGPEEMTAEEVWRVVTDAGFAWRVSPISSP